jgi:hypothetical protein
MDYKSFYFRGFDEKLNLKVQNLFVFMPIGKVWTMMPGCLISTGRITRIGLDIQLRIQSWQSGVKL